MIKVNICGQSQHMMEKLNFDIEVQKPLNWKGEKLKEICRKFKNMEGTSESLK